MKSSPEQSPEPGAAESLLPTNPGPSASAPAEDLDRQLEHCREMLTAGQFVEGEALATVLVERAVTSQRPRTAARAALLLARLMANSSRPRVAIAWAEDSIRHALHAEDRDLQAAAWVVVASSQANCDRPVLALDAIGRAMGLVDDASDSETRRAVFTGILVTYNALGLPQQALPAARRAFEAEANVGVGVERLRARWNLLVTGLQAHAQIATVDPVNAGRLLDELDRHADTLLHEARADGRAVYRAGAAHAVGQLRARQGLLTQGLELLSEAVSTPTEEPPQEMRERWIDLAWVQRELGNASAMAASAAEAQACADRIDEPPGFQDLESLARLRELQGRLDEALSLQRRHHEQVLHNVLAALEVRVAELSAQVSEQALRLEILELRERFDGLAVQARRLSELADTDALTGALTRRALETAYERLQKKRQPFALMLVDADHFKRVNDRHSHGVGDAVLRHLARLLAEDLRGDDRIGRYGGEEFTILLADLPLDQAPRVAERLRERVASHAWDSLAAGLSLSISAGLVEVAPDEPLEQALARADRLLYRAKDEGRDRILHDGMGSSGLPN